VTVTAHDSIAPVLDASATIDVTNATIVAVNISPNTVSALPAGYSQDFTATGVFSDGFTRPLSNASSWSLSNSNATLEQTGAVARVRGVAPGNVTLSYADRLANGALSGVSGNASITVTSATLESIAITPSSAFTLPVEAQQQFNAQGLFTGSVIRTITHDVAWDASVNTVAVFGDSRGKLTAISSGATSVMAISKAGDNPILSSALTVSVSAPTLESITISPDPGAVAIGETVQFSAIATFTGGITADYTERVLWESNDVETATVSTAAGTKGQVTGILAGSVTLTVTVPATATTNTLSITVQ
jgi:hypothetical protein